jgi:hypothetical protein
MAEKPATTHGYGDHDGAGVDLSLLRCMLQLTPVERLRRMEQHAQDTLLLYEYGRRHREAQEWAGKRFDPATRQVQ